MDKWFENSSHFGSEGQKRLVSSSLSPMVIGISQAEDRIGNSTLALPQALP